MTPTNARRTFSRSTKRDAYARASGKCECNRVPRFPFCCNGARLFVGKIIYEHVNPWEISRDSSPANCAVLRIECAQQKTDAIDAPLIASVHRKGDRHIGAYEAQSPMACGRDSNRSKTMRGEVVERKSQSEKLAETLARRRIG